MLELGSSRRLILVGGKRDGDRGARSSVSPPHGAWYWGRIAAAQRVSGRAPPRRGSAVRRTRARRVPPARSFAIVTEKAIRLPLPPRSEYRGPERRLSAAGRGPRPAPTPCQASTLRARTRRTVPTATSDNARRIWDNRRVPVSLRSTLDYVYDRQFATTTMHSRWTIGRHGLRRDTDFMAGKTAVSARTRSPRRAAASTYEPSRRTHAMDACNGRMQWTHGRMQWTYEPSRGSSLQSGDRGAPYMLQALAAWRADGWDSNDAPRQLVELDELERALTKQGEAESDLGLK